MTINWDNVFSVAHLNSGPFTSGLTISKIKPNGQGARSIWLDDKDDILKASKKYGYRIIVENKVIVSFFKSKENY